MSPDALPPLWLVLKVCNAPRVGFHHIRPSRSKVAVMKPFYPFINMKPRLHRQTQQTQYDRRAPRALPRRHGHGGEPAEDERNCCIACAHLGAVPLMQWRTLVLVVGSHRSGCCFGCRHHHRRRIPVWWVGFPDLSVRCLSHKQTQLKTCRAYHVTYHPCKFNFVYVLYYTLPSWRCREILLTPHLAHHCV